MSRDESLELQYPRDVDGKVLIRGLLRGRKIKEIPAEQVGGLDWTFGAMFGGVEEGVKMVESLAMGDKDKRWVEFLVVYRYLQEEAVKAGNAPPSLNSIAATLGIDVGEFLASVVEGIRVLNVRLAKAKIARELDKVTDAALLAAMDPGGTKDREMLFKMSGMIEQGGGVNVNVSQNVGVVVKGEELKAPLRQFKEDVEKLDDISRGDNVVDGEVVKDGE